MPKNTLVTLDMIKKAQERLSEVAHHTDLMPSSTLNDLCGCNVFLKMENTQRTGSFKLRGGYNKIASLTEEERNRGIVAASAGNHAQGVALGAKVFGAKATICMPTGAPLSKVEATKNYGANVVLAGACYDDAYSKAVEIVNNEGATFCHPFNDPEVIAGQGTIALEVLEDLPNTDVIIVPVGGGGLISGIAVAAKTINPNIRIIGVQTENMPSMKESLDANTLVTVPAKPSLADGIMVKIPGSNTFEIIKEYVDDIIVLSEVEIAEAIFFLLERMKTIAEGAGASPVAALLAHKVPDIAGKNVVAIVSGGNIDVNKIGQIINTGLVQTWRKVFLDVIVKDKPGVLAKITKIIADSHASILSISHERCARDIRVGEVHVSFALEVIDKNHVFSLIDQLRKAGHEVELL